MEYPIDIKNFQDAIYSICGITSIESGICQLDDIEESLEPVFNEIKEITKTLTMLINLYEIKVKL